MFPIKRMENSVPRVLEIPFHDCSFHSCTYQRGSDCTHCQIGMRIGGIQRKKYSLQRYSPLLFSKFCFSSSCPAAIPQDNKNFYGFSLDVLSPAFSSFESASSASSGVLADCSLVVAASPPDDVIFSFKKVSSSK